MSELRYTTPHGITVVRSASKAQYARGLSRLLKQLDTTRGAYLSSGYEYPGRYSRWDVASVAPPIEIIGRKREIEIHVLNQRGEILLALLAGVLRDHPHWASFEQTETLLVGELKPLADRFPEEERSKQPSAFSILRSLIQEFRHPEDSRLALVGAFGYDLLLEFDPIQLRLPRESQKDLHLFLCDDIYFMDRKREVIEHFQYDFSGASGSTAGLPRTSAKEAKPKSSGNSSEIVSDHTPEEYMAKVETVREGMRQGNYYEVVLRQTFSAPYSGSPSELFKRIQELNPSPYQFVIQMGDEQLVGASPEMFVRVEGERVETCPISGTARRSGDALLDAESIRELLNSTKEESELTMCSDVDRNDKSRVCVPGSVQVIGRRLIESYAALFHTVDHVTGTLMDGFDSLDAFLTHMWAVTVIGAPKKAAAQAVEDLEKDTRGWYGGAVGMISLNGDINTGILIRTVHLKDGMARYPAGATLLYDSDPASEDQECRLKATSFFRALSPEIRPETRHHEMRRVGEGVRMLLVDNDDCFIHTLANYARQTGVSVSTYRSNVALDAIRSTNPDIVLISPGPARPSDFGVPDLVKELVRRGIPTFGVCLGLQGVVEAFGGQLDVLGYPMHGKRSLVIHNGQGVFRGLPSPFRVGRYHSLHANRDTFPACLEITAESEDGIVMGIRHRELPLEAVQFHPESILTLERDCGLQLMENMVEIYASQAVALQRN
ncbi:MAG: anthranilate synthase component I [Acidobacteriaceae bacterium]|nr:anthranilate synthase component I [Acidobacteriaceae bacterium]MBV9779863.1 anthranilate synthase component I [Acidobacteriaceae bacterium]